ncbi:MAG TPA: SRPBCC family protein [Terriglobales bacterium]|jgi:uncharacterized protein YndB with AHSA1/START domain
MIKRILLFIVVVAAVVLIYAAFKPSDFSVRRTITIQASAEKIFPYINDFHNWAAWSPYDKLDPDMKKIISGPPSGKGAIYEWEGNGKAGQGSMEILESVPSSKVAIKLDFSKPLEGHDHTEFILQPNGNATNVTWAMSGPLNYPGKVMSTFFSMDKMVGNDFDKGLANLKTVAEK